MTMRSILDVSLVIPERHKKSILISDQGAGSGFLKDWFRFSVLSDEVCFQRGETVEVDRRIAAGIGPGGENPHLVAHFQGERHVIAALLVHDVG